VSEGFSSNYSGAGFSGMRFKVRSVEQGEFDRWVADARTQQETLSRDVYLQLAKPSEREPVRYFSSVDEELYSAIVGLCVEPGTTCMQDMMATDHSSKHETASSAPVDRSPLRGAGLPNPASKSDRPLVVDATSSK
jgi:cytochrome o ubiquinol oxidase subunit 2